MGRLYQLQCLGESLGGPLVSPDGLKAEGYLNSAQWVKAVNSLAGYAFAVLRFPGRNTLFGITVLTFLVPFEAISIPLYTVVRSLGWLDTYLALIVPGSANSIVVFLFRQFFAQLPQRYQTLWNELFAASSLAALIPLLVLLPLQRFYVQGVTAGGFK